jgi:hypothetical protein
MVGFVALAVGIAGHVQPVAAPALTVVGRRQQPLHEFLIGVPRRIIDEFADRVFHVHVKDSRVQLNGRNSILSSHLDFGDHRRGWDFVSPGRGDVKWDQIIRALNRAKYEGPLSIEWEDSGMSRDWGAPEALALVRKQDFAASSVAFDAAFASR